MLYTLFKSSFSGSNLFPFCFWPKLTQKTQNRVGFYRWMVKIFFSWGLTSFLSLVKMIVCFYYYRNQGLGSRAQFILAAVVARMDLSALSESEFIDRYNSSWSQKLSLFLEVIRSTFCWGQLWSVLVVTFKINSGRNWTSLERKDHLFRQNTARRNYRQRWIV